MEEINLLFFKVNNKIKVIQEDNPDNLSIILLYLKLFYNNEAKFEEKVTVKKHILDKTLKQLIDDNYFLNENCKTVSGFKDILEKVNEVNEFLEPKVKVSTIKSFFNKICNFFYNQTEEYVKKHDPYELFTEPYLPDKFDKQNKISAYNRKIYAEFISASVFTIYYILYNNNTHQSLVLLQNNFDIEHFIKKYFPEIIIHQQIKIESGDNDKFTAYYKYHQKTFQNYQQFCLDIERSEQNMRRFSNKRGPNTAKTILFGSDAIFIDGLFVKKPSDVKPMNYEAKNVIYPKKHKICQNQRILNIANNLAKGKEQLVFSD